MKTKKLIEITINDPKEFRSLFDNQISEALYQIFCEGVSEWWVIEQGISIELQAFDDPRQESNIKMLRLFLDIQKEEPSNPDGLEHNHQFYPSKKHEGT